LGGPVKVFAVALKVASFTGPPGALAGLALVGEKSLTLPVAATGGLPWLTEAKSPLVWPALS